MVSKMLPVIALVFVALAAADDADFFFSANQRAFAAQQASNCSVCTVGMDGTNVPCKSATSILSGTTYSAKCLGNSWSSTCTNGVMGAVTPSTSTVVAGSGKGKAVFVCPGGNAAQGAAFSRVCDVACNTTRDTFVQSVPNATAECFACVVNNTRNHRRQLRQVDPIITGAGGFLVVDCGCTLTGAAQTACCTECFTKACIAANGVPMSTCACGTSGTITCPSCSSKDSNKLLLLLLLLLLLIPLLLCCLLLCCCFLRRKKKEQDTHFSTFDPQAGSAILAAPMPVCAPAPTACVAPLLPTSGPCAASFAAPCATSYAAPAVYDAGVCSGPVFDACAAPVTTFGAPVL